MTDMILDALKEAAEYMEQEREHLLASFCPTRDGCLDVDAIDPEGKPFVGACESLIANLTAAIAAYEAQGWQDIASAPRGKYRDAPGPKGSTRKVFVPEPVDTWRDGSPAIRTWWLADGERWNGYSKDFPPTHWRPLPKPPSEP